VDNKLLNTNYRRKIIILMCLKFFGARSRRKNYRGLVDPLNLLTDCLTGCSERKEVGKRLVGCRRTDNSDGPVLFRAWPAVAAQLDVQVQSDRRRGPATSRAARMSQRLAARRSTPPVRINAVSVNHLHYHHQPGYAFASVCLLVCEITTSPRYVCKVLRSACRYVCLSVCPLARVKTNISPNFLYVLPVAVSRSSSGENTTRYVFPVSWTTSEWARIKDDAYVSSSLPADGPVGRQTTLFSQVRHLPSSGVYSSQRGITRSKAWPSVTTLT